MINYHDKEWGTPCHDDKKLFEYVVLDTFQAGLSWAIVLNKRENFRKALDGFNPKKVASYTLKDIRRLESDVGIIRNKLKIAATVCNAKAFLAVQKQYGSFDKYIWGFVDDGQPIVNSPKEGSQTASSSQESDAMSSDLSTRGFKFVGSTICYAFMQASGLVNDHLVSCFRYKTLNQKYLPPLGG